MSPKAKNKTFPPVKVTEEFLEAAITRYINQYGSFKNHGDYTVFFEPLGIMMSL